MKLTAPVALSAAILLAVPALATAKSAKSSTASFSKVVVVGGKTLCYGKVPAKTTCDARLPVPDQKVVAAHAGKSAKTGTRAEAKGAGSATTKTH